MRVQVLTSSTATASFPGIGRWWRGKPFNSLALEVTHRFDGTNEAAVNEWFRDTYGTCVTQTGNFLLGFLSESENNTIAAGLTNVVMDHLETSSTATAAPTWCSAADPPRRSSRALDSELHGIFRTTTGPTSPMSPSGAVLSIQPRSVTLQLTTFMGYFMTHLLMLGKLGSSAV